MGRIFTLLLFAAAAFSQDPYDVVLLHGKIVDGTGNAWFYGDLAIKGNRIARITGSGQLDEASALTCAGSWCRPDSSIFKVH
jgi:N-acyl-D-aspartate/D-glutamate deacylase